MALYCTVCQYAVPVQAAACSNCQNGFTAQLSCGTCGQVVERGLSYCPQCDRSIDVRLRPSSPPAPLGNGNGLLPLPLPPVGSAMGAPIPVPYAVAKSYTHGRFGVTAEVTLNGQDAEIMTLMSQAATLLHGLAAKMNQFGGIMRSTRECIRGCRDLASQLQEEIEVRRGPQG